MRKEVDHMVKRKNPDTLILEYIGMDDFSCPVYKDQFQHLWKDIDLGNSQHPSLYSVSNNEFDGEPMNPIQADYRFSPAPYRKNPNEFQYRMLSRLRSDCDYFLGYGNRNPQILCGNDPKAHINSMKELWNGFPENEKPEWLTWEQLLAYEKAICPDEKQPGT